MAPYYLHLKHTHTIRNSFLCSDEEQTLETSALENLNVAIMVRKMPKLSVKHVILRFYSRFSTGLSAVLSNIVEISTSPFVEDVSLILHNEGE